MFYIDKFHEINYNSYNKFYNIYYDVYQIIYTYIMFNLNELAFLKANKNSYRREVMQCAKIRNYL